MMFYMHFVLVKSVVHYVDYPLHKNNLILAEPDFVDHYSIFAQRICFIVQIIIDLHKGR